MPSAMTQQGGHCSTARLLRLLPDYRLRERNIFALYPSRRFLDAKVRTWVAFLQEQLPLLLAGHVRVIENPEYWAR